MGTINSNDTVKVELISNEFKISKENDQIIVIEHKPKPTEPIHWYEQTLVSSILLPILAALITILLTKFLNRKKEKAEIKKLELEINQFAADNLKIVEEVKQIRRSFQPIVLGTLQATQELIIKDKIEALKQIILYKEKIFHFDIPYYQGVQIIDDYNEYLTNLFNRFNTQDYKNFIIIFNNSFYFFPDKLIQKLNEIRDDISQLYETSKRQASIQSFNMPNDAKQIMDQLANKFKIVINEIRTDLHLDNSFIHDFIKAYQKIETEQ